MKKNTSNNCKIKPINKGIWHEKGYLKVKDPGLGEWCFMTEDINSSSDDYDVEAITIYEILNQSKYNEIDILKLVLKY